MWILVQFSQNSDGTIHMRTPMGEVEVADNFVLMTLEEWNAQVQEMQAASKETGNTTDTTGSIIITFTFSCSTILYYTTAVL